MEDLICFLRACLSRSFKLGLCSSVIGDTALRKGGGVEGKWEW